jgi:hypothetical protein
MVLYSIIKPYNSGGGGGGDTSSYCTAGFQYYPTYLAVGETQAQF